MSRPSSHVPGGLTAEQDDGMKWPDGHWLPGLVRPYQRRLPGGGDAELSQRRGSRQMQHSSQGEQ